MLATEMPKFATILVDLGADNVLTTTLNRPVQLNSFNQATLDDFAALWSWCVRTEEVHAVVLRAAGDRAFSTGVDVKEGFDRPANPFNDVDPGTWLSPKANRCWKPVVCAVHGMTAGGAFYWINEADIVIASEDATFFDPHVSFGLPAALEPIGMSRRIPIGEVLRMTLLGNTERMSAARAHQIGLVSEVVSREDLWPRAQDIAARIATMPTLAVQGSVRAIWESLDTGRTQALAGGMAYTQLGTVAGAYADRAKQVKRPYEIR